MQNLTAIGENLVSDISSRYGLSRDAVIHMLVSVNNGGGSMAQFNCPELGGSGQWMCGGMTMVGDMFNYGLKATVDNLCNELAAVLANNQVFPVIPAGTPGSSQWWPQELGVPYSSGSQNSIRYAIFPNRLAVESSSHVSVYDTLDHNIGGVSQQQGNNTSLTFSSQYGTIEVSNLPIVSGSGLPQQPHTNFATPIENALPPNVPEYSQQESYSSGQQNTASNIQPVVISAGNQPDLNETLELIGKLSQLRDAGALTDDEFNSKKSDLLSRI
ncbi:MULTISPECIES: SHOCT domain-containing protein [unclassified Neptuniibacter]|uniref:SHOCT domain-containing protein n=1 Tax=unclassified Neptuniibacter TaxID=2630693 RepID=UPI000C5BBC16|nr:MULTISPECIES: SHOCT domain-containing protein [unclassified Neptuniibacter]MAY42168.1 hypothetical protein [Oceanospirillaceae bacterium]|tara:strand:+ start:24679 stop:25494 length:816 start_codon:yes stop_codon:yes gene_type:complete